MLKFTNNTNNKIWIGRYCFVPGESTVDAISAEELIPMLASLEHKDWKEAISNKLISFEIDKKTLAEIEEIKNPKKTEEVKTDVKETK